MPTSSASATWNGVLRSGNGHFAAGSGAFEGDYTFPTRFEGAAGTNPEELIAAAHAACLSMALSVGLEKAGTPAHVDHDQPRPARWRWSMARPRSPRCGSTCRGSVDGIDNDAFVQAAEGCERRTVPCPRLSRGISTSSWTRPWSRDGRTDPAAHSSR